MCTCALYAQTGPERPANVPLYRVTVIDRTVTAVDYQYRSGPTRIDFRGTVLMPPAKGEAMVESKAGRVEVDARFNRLAAPTRFGREYLTYVLWAITPEGHAKNLGEVLPGSSDNAHLRVTTDLQAFGLIVTAEPYSAVRQPSDVVVMENEIRPDTIGRREPIQAKYELLPRGHYTYNVPADFAAAEGNGPKLSMDQYQQIVEVYQAQNALQIAQAAGADQYAPDTYRKAADLLAEAQNAQAHKGGMAMVVTIARQAAQTAEDARILAIQRKQQDDLAAVRERAARAEASKAQAEAAALTAQTEAAASRALLEQERAARRQAAAAAASAAPPPPEVIVETRPPSGPDPQHKTELRMRLFGQLNAELPALDTPRGLVVTVPDSVLREAEVGPAAYGKLAGIASIIRSQPDLSVYIEGHGRLSVERADAVRDFLVKHGVPAGAITARGVGDARPIVSNTTASGREQNRRVEIIIAGDSIGQLPHWEKAYNLIPQR
ncbi:MAG TPA: OmpA family protein [Bryobacteraceae bacterium]|nr:OmpA family protein [Bryobacteraceae bacterium]